MSVPVITFFNNKGGVGKTSLVYHLAWMLSEMGRTVVAMDLDAQANLTSAFLSEERMESLWVGEEVAGGTIYECIRPLTKVGDLVAPKTQRIADRLELVPGDLRLAGFEDALSTEWPRALDDVTPYRAFRMLSSFWLTGQSAAQQSGAEVILADVGPNLGAINRSALIGSDHVVVPVAADLFSLQGLENLGPTLKRWRTQWESRKEKWKEPEFGLPDGAMRPAGYVLMQHSERLSRPVKAYGKWAEKIPETYRRSIWGDESGGRHEEDCLARIKHYRSLVPMAQEARKPVFDLTAADGAIGSHSYAVRDARADFRSLAERILETTGLA